jgi:hypothetical protein
MASSKGRMNEYTEDQSQAQSKDYFMNKFNVYIVFFQQIVHGFAIVNIQWSRTYMPRLIWTNVV